MFTTLILIDLNCEVLVGPQYLKQWNYVQYISSNRIQPKKG